MLFDSACQKWSYRETSNLATRNSNRHRIRHEDKVNGCIFDILPGPSTQNPMHSHSIHSDGPTISNQSLGSHLQRSARIDHIVDYNGDFSRDVPHEQHAGDLVGPQPLLVDDSDRECEQLPHLRRPADSPNIGRHDDERLPSLPSLPPPHHPLPDSGSHSPWMESELTGMSKKPWIWEECSSTQTTSSVPAACSILATSCEQ